MKNPIAVIAGLIGAIAVVLVAWLLTGQGALAAEGNEPTQLVTLCQQTVDTTPVNVLRDCATGYQKLCPTGYDLGQVIVNVTSAPYWVAAEVTCKPGTRA